MVTAGRCEAFAVIYLGKMIDSLTVSKRCFTAGLFFFTAFCWACAGRTSSSKEVLAKCPLQQRVGTSEGASSAHYLAGVDSRPEVGKGTLWEQNRVFLISLAGCLPSRRPRYGMTSCCDLWWCSETPKISQVSACGRAKPLQGHHAEAPRLYPKHFCVLNT